MGGKIKVGGKWVLQIFFDENHIIPIAGYPDIKRSLEDFADILKRIIFNREPLKIVIEKVPTIEEERKEEEEVTVLE